MNEKTTDLLCSICLSETKKDYKKKKKNAGACDDEFFVHVCELNTCLEVWLSHEDIFTGVVFLTEHFSLSGAMWSFTSLTTL